MAYNVLDISNVTKSSYKESKNTFRDSCQKRLTQPLCSSSFLQSSSDCLGLSKLLRERGRGGNIHQNTTNLTRCTNALWGRGGEGQLHGVVLKSNCSPGSQQSKETSGEAKEFYQQPRNVFRRVLFIECFKRAVRYKSLKPKQRNSARSTAAHATSRINPSVIVDKVSDILGKNKERRRGRGGLVAQLGTDRQRSCDFSRR